MGVYKNGKKLTAYKTIVIEKGGENDAELFVKKGTYYDQLTEYAIQQLMTGRYKIQEGGQN